MNFFKIFGSVLASFIGIQGDKKFNEDDAYLEKNGFAPYLITGIFLVLIFLFSLIVIVSAIIS